jgi:hypothetical protein
MAVTITRTAWIDDDGTGTSGTVINNAEKTTIYNQIDAALAQLAQLAGGNTFTGAQNVTGSLGLNALTATYGTVIALTTTGGLPGGIAVQNYNPSNAANFILFYNSVNGQAGNIAQTGATSVSYSTTSDARLKDDLGAAMDLAALRAVVVHDFTWKADGARDRGVFAQDAHALYPRAVVPGTDERTMDGALARPWMTDYSKFVPDLIVGWQQHDAAIAEFRALLKGSL